MGDLVEVKPRLPVPYSEEIAEAICDAICTSRVGLERLCDRHPSWPDVRTIYRWRLEHPEFRDAYELARKLQVETLMDELVEIADDASGDARLVERRDGSSETVMDREFVERSKLRCHARATFAGKVDPAKWGDKLDVTARLGMRHEDVLRQLE